MKFSASTDKIVAFILANAFVVGILVYFHRSTWSHIPFTYWIVDGVIAVVVFGKFVLDVNKNKKPSK